jgi:hypothetical protein
MDLAISQFQDGPSDLAERLSVQYASNFSRVRDGSPGVAKRYATVSQAESAVRRGEEVNSKARGKAGRFYVTHDDRVIGIATYDQGTLWEHGSRFPVVRGRELASGPMLAMWLGAVAGNRPPRLLPDLLELGAAVLFGRRAVLHGHPWTLVRPGQSYVLECLLDSTNVYGGFEVVSKEMDLARVDGVEALRFVLVARRTVSELLSG